MRHWGLSLIAFLIVFNFLGKSAWADKKQKVQAEIVTETLGINLTSPTWLAIVLNPEPGWHLYWKNPGDTGTPTKIKLTDTTDFEMGELIWPSPEKFKTGDLISFGYDSQVVLPFSLSSKKPLHVGTSYTLNFEARWLTCKDVCIPEHQSFSLSLKVIDIAANQPGSGTKLIHDALGSFPVPSQEWRLEGKYPKSGNLIELKATPNFRAPVPQKDYEVFVESPDVIAYDQPAQVEVAAGNESIRIFLHAKGDAGERPEKLKLLLTHKKPWQTAVNKVSHSVSFTFEMENARKSAAMGEALSTNLALKNSTSALGTLQMLVFAFLGGLLLNLMPCVFPVLSLKAYGLIQDAGRNAGLIRAHGIIFTGGVLAAFWILALTLALIQKAGAQVGWGFQLQSPSFVSAMIYLFFILGLNLAGVFEMGTSLMGVGSSLVQNRAMDLAGAFITGVLSVIVASPCTAPFMGVALGFAISQTPFIAFLIFTSLGLGLAFPFLILSLYPKLASKLPRPGAWMETFKNLLSIPLFGTVAWLVWVLELQSQNANAIIAGLFLVSIGAWIYGQRLQSGHTAHTRKKSLMTTTVALLGIIGTAFLMGHSGETSSTHQGSWETYTPSRLKQLRAEGKPVLVDYTAAWCITCLVNEKVALNTVAVQNKLKEKGVVTLRADWTNEDATITNDLKSFERSGVPLYVLYPKVSQKNSDSAPKILPQILTPGIVIDSLDQL